jgi:hypothetical protein
LEQKCHCNRLDLPCGGWVVCLVIWKVPQGATLLSIFLPWFWLDLLCICKQAEFQENLWALAM